MLIIITDEQKNRYVWNSHRSVELETNRHPSPFDSGFPDVFHLDYGFMKDKIPSKKIAVLSVSSTSESYVLVKKKGGELLNFSFLSRTDPRRHWISIYNVTKKFLI